MTRRKKTILLSLVLAGLLGCNGGAWSSGDRVLVAKCLYDTPLAEPDRYDVVVFKYPDGPMEKHTPKNYIKRLIGLPGEVIAIFFGQLYRWAPGPGDPLPFKEEDKDVNPLDLWKPAHAHIDARHSRELFEQGKFEILRKPPDQILALRRIVYDNDYPPRDLVEMGVKRWEAGAGWEEAPSNGFRFAGGRGDKVGWLRYRHRVVPRSAEQPAAGGREVRPTLITDAMGYNSFEAQGRIHQAPAPNWVSDLMLECNVELPQGGADLTLELSQGAYRYQARWKSGQDECTLVRIHPGGKEETLDAKPTRLKAPGSYLVRFANFDSRLTVWVDRELPFGDGVVFPPSEVQGRGEKASEAELLARRGPTENDLEPASIGCVGDAVTVSRLKLWRDTYYTLSPNGPDYTADAMPAEAWSDPKRWEPLRRQDFRTWYVQPGHYLCLGDNSTASSDSRQWGLVPERLMLGRALVVYFPLHRAGAIR